MKKIKKNASKKKKKRKVTLFNLIFAAVTIYFILGYISQANTMMQYKNELKIIEQKTAEQEEKLRRLQDLEPLYKSEEYIEKIAREKLGLVYSDEKVFIEK